jgi:putative redox protein
METMRVTPAGGDRLAIALRGHEIMVDQPAEVGGTDIGPTPTELFVAGLVSCVATYASHFLARHGVCSEGLRVDADWEMGEGRTPRVGCVTIRITPPPTLPTSRLPALLAVSRACTVHNSLAEPPAVRIDVATSRI